MTNTMSSLKKTAIVLAHVILGWALCGLIVAVGMAVTTPVIALTAHAILGPLVFAALSGIYFRYFGYTEPIETAVIFLAVVIFLDFFVVALLIEKSFAMFASLIGTWLPWALIFAMTYLTGRFIRTRTP